MRPVGLGAPAHQTEVAEELTRPARGHPPTLHAFREFDPSPGDEVDSLGGCALFEHLLSRRECAKVGVGGQREERGDAALGQERQVAQRADHLHPVTAEVRQLATRVHEVGHRRERGL